MKQSTRLMSKLLGRSKVTPTRLRNFANDTLTRLEKEENATTYADYIVQLTPVLQVFGDDLSSLDSSLNHGKTKTKARRAFIKGFKAAMKEKDGLVAHLVGGFESEGYTAFYPNGTTEYTAARISEMPALVKRVNNEAETYAGKLGTDITAMLQSFEQEWLRCNNNLTVAKSTINDQREKLKATRTALEQVLTKLFHAVALEFDGDEGKFKSFFDLGLLYYNGGKKAAASTVAVPKEETTVVAKQETVILPKEERPAA